MGKVKAKRSKVTDRWAMYCGDCCEVMPSIPSESVGFCAYSPPFVSLYSYSDDDADMGNCKDYDGFFKHFKFLSDQLFRVLMPGRIMAVHCMDLPMFKNAGEEIGLRDFSGDLIRCFQDTGFIFHSRHCIWKDPLIAATRTHAIGLAHKQIVKDSSICRTGTPDYILAFRKPGENPKPIAHPEGLTEYHGSRPIPHELDRFSEWGGLQKENKRSHWIWQKYASPVWDDIRQTKVLQFRGGREEEDERHICPLQTDIVYRCLTLWSAPDDIVLDPFGGIGTTGYVAIKMGRKAIMIELKPSYFKQACKNMDRLRPYQTM